MVDRMEYVGNAAPTTLATDMSIGGLSFTLTDFTGYPTGVVGKFSLVINAPTPSTPGGATEETILCLTQDNGLVTVDPSGRGFDGTLPQTHSAGESVQVCWTASAADQDNLHNTSTGNVHGVAGDVVGDSDEQTLTNKTIDASLNTLLNFVTSGQILDTNASPGLWPTYTAGAAHNLITATEVDGTYATLTFTAPVSGQVKLVFSGLIVTGNDGNYPQIWWQNRAGGANLTGTKRISNNLAAWQLVPISVSVPLLAAGLTAGTEYTVDLWADCNGGTEGFLIYDWLVECVSA